MRSIKLSHLTRKLRAEVLDQDSIDSIRAITDFSFFPWVISNISTFFKLNIFHTINVFQSFFFQVFQLDLTTELKIKLNGIDHQFHPFESLVFLSQIKVSLFRFQKMSLGFGHEKSKQRQQLDAIDQFVAGIRVKNLCVIFTHTKKKTSTNFIRLDDL